MKPETVIAIEDLLRQYWTGLITDAELGREVAAAQYRLEPESVK